MTTFMSPEHCAEAARFTKSRLLARLSLTTAFVVGLGINSAHAGDQQKPSDDLDQAVRDAGRAAETLARESSKVAGEIATQAGEMIDDAMDAIGRTVRKLPQYKQPEMDDEGNIIIRRKPTDEAGTEI